MRYLPARASVLAWVGVFSLCLAAPAEATRRHRRQTAPPDSGAPAQNDPEGISLGEGGPPGSYRGVAPGQKVAPPHAPRRKTPVAVTWTGFQMRPEGGSRVFVQLTSDVPYQVSDTAEGVLVTLRGAHLNLRNNGRALDTRYFDTPVKAVKVVQRSGEVQLSIETRGKPAHSERVEPQGGYQFLLIDFPTDGAGSASPQSKTTNK